MQLRTIKNEWFSNVRGDILAGLTVALALIPEAIGFSIIANVDPMVALYASFCIALIIAFVGGRPGMISAATGAMALVIVTLVANHGVEYLFAATILTGIIQFVMGALRLGRFITFVPRPVMVGFVNSLAILLFLAQLAQFRGATWIMYGMVAGTLAIIYFLPRLTKAVPSPLIAIVVMTTVAILTGAKVSTVGDMGQITRAMPVFRIPVVPFSLETLKIIFPYAFTLSIVGILESLLTATIVDQLTATESLKNKEVRGQGIANVITGFFGGMAGCAMIGQSVINVKSGGRGRLSTLVAGVFMLFLIIILGDIVKQIPMAALVGVMMMVSIGTFDWQSLKDLRKIPLSDSVVMVTTVIIVIVTKNLAKGVFVGVIMSALIFGWRSGTLTVTTSTVKSGTKIYHIAGQLFFASTNLFSNLFDYENDPNRIVIDFSNSHVWDQSAVTALENVIDRYESLGKHVTISGLDEKSEALVTQMGLSTSSSSLLRFSVGGRGKS